MQPESNSLCRLKWSWLLVVLCILFSVTLREVQAQKPAARPEAPSLCERQSALNSIGQQIEVSRTIDNAVHRIAVLLRAADLQWSHQPADARATFVEAFEVATRHEKEKSEGPTDRLAIFLATPDERHVVVRAVTKRDASLARKLTEQILDQERRRAEQSTSKNQREEIIVGQKLLQSAGKLLTTDRKMAMELATMSFKYPGSQQLTRFLYELAEIDQPASDQFYLSALANYADRPMREFLYLAAYPFAFDYSGDTPVFAYYQVPPRFTTNVSLQRSFAQTLVRRGLQALESPLDEGDNYNWLAGSAHIVQVLSRIEPHLAQSSPEVTAAVGQAKERLRVSLPLDTQGVLTRPESATGELVPQKTFDELMEAVARLSDVNKRDELIVTTILGWGYSQDLETPLKALDKIDDTDVRALVAEWVYFNRTNDAIKKKQFAEAVKSAAKVEDLEYRAYQHVQIAKAFLDSPLTELQARELLDQAIAEAKKASRTLGTARTLFQAAVLYARLNLSRSLEVLGEAINATNSLEAPKFSDDNLLRDIKGKTFTRRVSFYMPGLDPEGAFREMAKVTFDDTFAQVNRFSDKSQRALVNLAVADVCLQQLQEQQQRQPRKAPRKKTAP